MIVLLTSTGTASADEPDDQAQTTASEASEESERTGNADAESRETAQAQDPESEILDKDPRALTLRFADRRQVLFRLGIGGTYKGTVDDTGAKPTYGATFRWDRPVHDYVTTGLAFSFYSARTSEERYREPAFDIALILKGRYPFEMGKKAKLESEVYVLFQIGMTIWIDSNAIDLNLIGPGWNTGIAPGYQFFINDRVGILAEVGWMRTEAYFSRGWINLVLNQVNIRLGMVFPF